MHNRFKHIIAQHRPAGYSIKRPKMTALDGVAIFQREINVAKELSGPDFLFVLLHECGHVHMRHLIKDGNVVGSSWREEYEADQYAIKAMREAGVPIPRDRLQHQKKLVRELIETSDHVADDEDVLRYAYGRNWRRHR
jgi:Zn-dependent protease with chaperone function